MFERYLTDALTTNFGHFIENLDADKVRLSAWNGELVLQDLTLRPNALEHFLGGSSTSSSLPNIELTYGHIGNLELRIPWSLFRSQLRWKSNGSQQNQPQKGGGSSESSYLSSACSVVLSDVNILITPRRRRDTTTTTTAEEDARENDDIDDNNNDDDDDETLEQRRIRKEKIVQSLLDGHLLRRVTESTVSKSSSNRSSSRWNWVQDLLSTLLSTLSVTVRNIHVRYEDPGSCMGFVWDGTAGATTSTTATPLRERSISTSTVQQQQQQQPVPRSMRQYRPPFAVGITLQQFSVEVLEESPSTTLEEQQRRDDDEEEEKEGEVKDEPGRTTSSTISTTAQSSSSRVAAAAAAVPTCYEVRRKVAVAERLAIYWDSDCNLMAVHSDKLCQEVDNGQERIMEYKSYYQAAFAIANTQNTLSGATATASTPSTTTNNFGHESWYNQRHSYVLDPISPAVNLNLVVLKEENASEMAAQPPRKLDSIYSTDDSDDSSNDESAAAAAAAVLTTKGPQQPEFIPPSSMRIHLPPCKFTLARSTLEDTAYLRKSLSIWRHSTKGIFSEASLRRLAKLRPHRSPKQDPQGWWFYAVHATLVLSRGNRGEGRQNDLKVPYSSKAVRRKRGWKGFWEAFQRRKRYVALCHSLVTHNNTIEEEDPDSNSIIDSATANQQLLEMEDGLTPDEIVAFRLALYETWQSMPQLVPPYHKKATKEKTPASTSGWQRWTSASEKQSENVLEPEQDLLSLNHRISMMHEMTQALERERANSRKSARDEVRQASMLSAVDWQVDDDDLDSSTMNWTYPVVWEASVACREIAIQVNDESSDFSRSETSRTTPVVRFSCAWIQDQRWYKDDSWDIECSLASLLVKDLTVSKDNVSQGYFPNLIARKVITEENAIEAESMWIEGVRHQKGLSITIQRRLHWNGGPLDQRLRDEDRGSVTTSRVRILPMEVVYSTVPVEVATRVLGTVKTPELVDDYHRMASAAYGWQKRQGKKLLAALAHKRKKIILDIDVGAPELLIPEDINHPESPMLAIDLGRLQIFNDEASMESPLDYDDQWRLVLSNIQVRSATVAAFDQRLSFDPTKKYRPIQAYPSPRHLVEPFSLDFAISTKIAGDDSQDQTKIHIAATLPRLAFNINSSSIRLVSRLQRQFQSRRSRKKVTYPLVPSMLILRSEVSPNETTHERSQTDPRNCSKSTLDECTKEDLSSRVIEFDFTAPFINLRLANDTDDIQRFVDLLHASPSTSETPLLDLSFRGIGGTLIQESGAAGESSTLFDARLHSLGVIDLFQTAGRDFALLMSSAPPEKLNGLVFDGGRYYWVNGSAAKPEIWSGKDLVTIRYSSTSAKGPDGKTLPKKLAVGFHELYVEWNPETFASIQNAVRIPDEEKDIPISFVKTPERSPGKESVSEHEFFDAVENASFDSLSDVDSDSLGSEIASSSFETAEVDFHDSVRSWNSAFSLGIQTSLSNVSAIALSFPKVAYSSITPLSPHDPAYPIRPHESTRDQPPGDSEPVPSQTNAFELVFELSKLRMSFNKDARHRKVMIAQMDGTSVSYKTRTLGGSRTTMNIGNLVFIDPTSAQNSTLYSQILGLKTSTPDQHSGDLSSLLEMEILINPQTRSFDTGFMLSEDNPDHPVAIDRKRGIAIGSNFFVRAKFSPMRFVFLEQLWFEFIDYFFEGIIGNEVWGGAGSKAKVSQLIELSQFLNDGNDFLPGSDAKGFNFTRFDISLESPELLFPVTYRSPHFLRLDVCGIHVSNKYDGMLIEDGTYQEVTTRMQWFNNCSIAMKKLRLFSWNGQELGQHPIVSMISLRWPTGPTAPLVTPKWRVNCNFDSLDIVLRRTDYALIQHILSHNIGEESRHLIEWRALQQLSPANYLAYSESILVHFGYDKKDVTPTTYDLKVCIPSVSVKFVESESDPATLVGVAQCLDLIWSLRKDSDLVVNQKATFDVSLSAPTSSSSFEKLLSSWKYDQDTLMEDIEIADDNDEIPELTYTSTTLPCGDNTKTLEIVDACIYSDVCAWRCLSGFFSALPEPTIFSETEIGSSIQVGDRWYKIGGNPTTNNEKRLGNEDEASLPWIKSFPEAKNTLTTKHHRLASQTSHSPPTFQMLLSLTSPRIILSSDPSDGAISRLVLRMNHLDFLQVNSGVDCRITRTFLLDEVEVYTLSNISSKRRKREDGNSLIHPWSVGAIMEKCNGSCEGNCQKHISRISADLLQARAAYSDMAVAIEVCLSVAHSAKTTGSQNEEKANSTSSGSLSRLSVQTTGPELSPRLSIDLKKGAVNSCVAPDISLFDLECDGFELLVKDDSGRHFATNQDLIILSLGKVLFSRREWRGKPSSMRLHLSGFDLFDCLQAPDSPFRTAATTRSGTMVLIRNDDNFARTEGEASPSSEQRTFDWDAYKIKSEGEYKFRASTALVQRLDATSRQCSSAQEELHGTDYRASRVIEARCILDGQEMQEYDIKFRCLLVQWNPSTTIAIQRFLGRLRKESKSKIVQVFHSEVDDLLATKSIDFGEVVISPAHSDLSETSSVKATIEFQELKLCLNKEHQNRRLLEMTLSACRLDLNSTQKGMSVDGRVGTLTAWDPDDYSEGIQTENRHFLKTTPTSKSSDGLSNFLNFHYRTFKGLHPPDATDALPAWVRARISEIGGIDDFLSVQVASTEFTYLKERTEELIDYLSNGLPGKGMGVTSRAAKGFISKRILTKSFLEFQNDSPQIFVPQHEQSTDGISLQLGDVNVKSYFEDENVGANSDWWRVLSLGLLGSQVGVRENNIFSPATNPIDLSIYLRKPTTKGGDISIRGKLSFVNLILKYSDYMLIRYVAKDNIGKTVDTDKWDNIEKAYWSEEIALDSAVATFSLDDEDSTHQRPAENRVAYSSNARFIRYGKGGKRKHKMDRKGGIDSNPENVSPSRSFEKSGTSIGVTFVLDGLSLKLTRDDRLDEIGDEEFASAFSYDVILLRVQVVEISVNSAVSGESSFHLSLFRLGLFDLGDKGRLMRERYYGTLLRGSPCSRKGSHRGPRRPCPFYVIAEGYAPDDEGNEVSNTSIVNQDGPQFVVTIESCSPTSARAIGSMSAHKLSPDSKVTIAGVVVNYLSLNFLVRPLKEAVSFLACEWPMPKHRTLNSSQETRDGVRSKRNVSNAVADKVAKNEGLQLKLVANYPRVFFLADESDLHSRALVLRGLAVVNMSKITVVDDADIKRVLSVGAQLHSMESYINADVHHALCFKPSHFDMVGEANSQGFPQPEEDINSMSSNALGVALIQPVTAGIEFCDTRRDRFPTKRTVFVNVEPVSTMLSFEDLNLIETVVARLSSARSSNHNSQEMHGDELLSMYSEASITPASRSCPPHEAGKTETFEVSFTSQRLGLGLKTSGGMTVVSSVQNVAHKGSIEIEDALIAIGGVDCIGSSLDDVVKRLSSSMRPISLTFNRHNVPQKLAEIPEKETLQSPANQNAINIGTADELLKDFSVSTYKITFKKGMKNGLELERSHCGGWPVVTSVDHNLALSASELFSSHSYAVQIEQHSIRAPLPGAVVVAINDVPVQEFGVDETWAQIETVIDLPSDLAIDPGSYRTYSLSFLEIDSELWGKVENIEISSSGFALSFIDDLHGRDMPLFRGKLNALKIHAERGLGGRAQIIEVQPSSILTLEPNASGPCGTIASLNKQQIHDLRSESVVTLSGIGLCIVDYFHPRIAFWEPLVEPSQLFLLLEKQSGCQSSKRPGQVAVELSDRLLREQSFRANALPSIGASPQMVTFNLTDSSAEVAIKALSQWKEWRKSKLVLTQDDDPDDYLDDVEIELRESNPIPDENEPLGSPLGGIILNEDRFGGSPRLEPNTETRRDAKRAAAQKAAQAALVFAQKRGADSSKKGDSAKPFVLRNRTGVSIAFVQQDARSNLATSERTPQNLSVVGEYTGLAEHNPLSVHELSDKEDARFSMEIMSDDSSRGKRDQLPSNKVRNYEGRFPGLTVAIQAVSGVCIEPLVDLQVYKVGSTVHHLIVRKDIAQTGQVDSTEYSIPVVWKVEIEDNRRVLTLSTAVRVVTTAFATQMEIGVQRMSYDEPLEKTLNSSQTITCIGVVRPESPFYLPLWLALKLEAVSIFVRPRTDGASLYGWGRSSILRFAPFWSAGAGPGHDENFGTWVWEETFEELDYIHCDGIDERYSPVWLAVFSGSASNSAEQVLRSKTRQMASTRYYEEEHHEVISVTLDSNVTIRNMLPMSVDWQIAQVAYGSVPPAIVDGSHARNRTSNQGIDGPPLPHKSSLHCGECTEVFACDYGSSGFQARFKEPDGQNWSAWAPLRLEDNDDFEQHKNDEDDVDVKSLFPRSRQVNVQVTNDSFGVPLTFGVRIVPKMTFGSLDEPVKTQIYGIEIIVYAELWIRNITSLPLNFGCPSYQVHGIGSPAEIFDETATRFNAESALMEIASLLEVGDKGMGLNKQVAREVAAAGSIESLPNQECGELWEEVFEYLEIDHSTVKRRWWASESYDSFRMNITVSNESGSWYWFGENWVSDVEEGVIQSKEVANNDYLQSIDTAGEVNASLGGWESCRNLLGGSGSFSGKRIFDSNHSIRRRRYYRNRSGHSGHRKQFRLQQSEGNNPATPPGCLHGSLQAFHQPLNDSFSREQNKILRRKKRQVNSSTNNGEKDTSASAEAFMQIAVKCADGKWSVPTTIPDTGTSHGALRVLASRWPALTIAQNNYGSSLNSPSCAEKRGVIEVTSPFHYQSANLSPKLYELCYTVSDVDGEWGEFSRSMLVSPRFMVRNDSARFCIEVKQAGTSDTASLKLIPGASEAFYWEDFRLPGLLCVSPCVTTEEGRSVYKWSGGFDICNLGMVPLRIRRESTEEDASNAPVIRSIRALVEIRPGTGGFGINVSFCEEDPAGDGSLFRIENLSPFPVWFSQDGVLANPSKILGQTAKQFVDNFEANGDPIRPSEKRSFALDVPYRQGKYAHRKEATLKELLRVRIALAPLAHRAGIETVKVIAMTNVGETIRLNPSKLFGILDDELRTRMYGMRVVAIVCSDGPTRVLKLLLAKVPAEDVIGSTFREVSYMATKQNTDPVIASSIGMQSQLNSEVKESATTAFTLYCAGELPDEENAKKGAIFKALEQLATETELATQSRLGDDTSLDQIYSIRAEFSGFLFSLVDSTPSEIAVATLRNFNVLARWNELRTNEASFIMSVGWLQVDNHVPNAPFKVAIKPDSSRWNEMDEAVDSTDNNDTSPLLMVAIAFAPKHKSSILCLRSVTIAPRNLVIAVDLAFLVRLQRFFLDLKNHFRARSTEDENALNNAGVLLMYADQKRNIIFPRFRTAEEELNRAAEFGTENQNLYFQGLTILPAAITLSVAPARALSPAQANLEGKEVAAIHQAVRKGDVLVGSSSALLGVRVGRINKTPLAVVRGVFKSIVVDALLRLDGASLNFSGVFLRNHISTGPQLTTYLLAHYLASLRQNVPALIGSLAAFGNPLGLIRGLGDGMSDFVSQPVQGLKKSVRELDPSYLVDGVARGTGSLARHAVGGIADSASLLTETFSKNMAVLTLDRRYAQKRDRNKQLRLHGAASVTLAEGVESGFIKLVQGFMDGVTGVVQAPMRGAEKKGIEGFAKGFGKGLLGLLVKPIIGISDAATDVMIGVKHSVDNASGDHQENLTLDRNQFRPRRPMYGRDKVLRPYRLEDAAASALMLRTRCAGENYLSHLDLGDRVALLSVKRMILLGPKGQELMALKYKHVAKAEVRQIPNEDNSIGWAIIVVLNTPRKNGSEVEVLSCTNRQEAEELCVHIQRGIDLVASDHPR